LRDVSKRVTSRRKSINSMTATITVRVQAASVIRE
jgi:hypothetical protein